MIKKIKKTMMKYLDSLAYKTSHFSDLKMIDDEFGLIYQKCSKYTVTTKMSLYALYKAVKYIAKSKIAGDIVECGVWKGGSAMVIAYALIDMNEIDRKIYLYDTFTGMTEPTKEDIAIPNKASAINKWNKNKFNDWETIPLQEAKENILSTGYPEKNLIFIKGDVQDTLLETKHEKISLLRLDTDWYESTMQELVHLYPSLSERGVLIIDDYGYWAGSKKATDDFLEDKQILLNRIDQTGRIGIKSHI